MARLRCARPPGSRREGSEEESKGEARRASEEGKQAGGARMVPHAMDGWMSIAILDGWMSIAMDGWMDEHRDGWMDG